MLTTVGLVIAALGVIAAFGTWLWPHAGSAVRSSVPAGHRGGLLVTQSFGSLTVESPPRLGSDDVIVIEVANPLPRPYRIVSVGLVIEDAGKTIPWMTPGSEREMPFALQETERNKFWASAADVAATLISGGLAHPVRIRAFVQDSSNGVHLSEWAAFNPMKCS